MSSLRPASFRGVRFDVDSRSVTVGRRVVVHEYPQRDIPFAEDMGRKARRYKIDVLVIGDDFEARRDALIRAIETPGAGLLVHPDFGSLMVVVLDDAEITQRRDEIGKSEFSITFMEAGEALYPSASQDTAGILGASSEAAVKAAIDEFAAEFDVSGGSDLQQSAQRNLLKIINQLSDTLASAADFSPADMLSLLPAPLQLGMALANAVVNGVMNVKTQMAITASAWKRFDVADLLGLERLQVLRPAPVIPSRGAGIQAIKNQVAMDALIGQTIAATLMNGYATLEFASIDEVENARAKIAAAADNVFAFSGNANDEMLAQRTAAIRHINAVSIGLPKLMTIRLSQSMPALAVAYEQHGNLEYLDDLLARNHVIHPGFVPAGRDLSLIRI